MNGNNSRTKRRYLYSISSRMTRVVTKAMGRLKCELGNARLVKNKKERRKKISNERKATHMVNLYDWKIGRR